MLHFRQRGIHKIDLVSTLAWRNARVYGFASTLAYLNLEPGAFTINAMTGLNWKNAIVAVPLSLLIGSGLGIAQGWFASVLAAGNTRAAPVRALRLDGSPVVDGNSLKAR